jgi:LEA14-like dessication related protein
MLTLSGCAGLGKRLESPRIHIASIQVQEIKPLEAVFKVELRVLNTNDIPIVARGINCDLEINDKHFASGVSSAVTDIPALGAAVVPVEVYSSVLDMVRSVMGLKDQETLKYKIRGRLRVEGGPWVPSFINYESDGELNLQDLRPVSSH